VDSLGNNVYKRRAETFLNWSYLLTEEMNYVEETWMNLKSCEEASKMLLTDAEATPRVALIDETKPILALAQSPKTRTDNIEVGCATPINAFNPSVVLMNSNVTSRLPSVRPSIRYH
jgi:hypothetical protein